MKKLLALMTTVLILMFFSACDNNANKISLVGKFYGSHIGTDLDGNKDIYYEFKSNDGSVWWSLTDYQMGFIPKTDVEYILTYDNKGTTKENKPCDCAAEYDCECEVYDDEFVSIKEVK